jgi:pimeloyl-ACP methyl ester carboxylesterase
MTSAKLTASVIRLASGRELSFCEFGDPAGTPVFGFHGTPGSRLQLQPTSSSPLGAGIRLIIPDRPGYGHSTFYDTRRLIDWPADVTAIAEFLDIDRFAVFGVSGGGPHALVCAHHLADRLLGVACVSGVGQLGDARAAEGMMRLNRILNTLAKHAGWLVRALFSAQFAYIKRRPEQAWDVMVRQLPQADRRILGEPELRANMIDDLRRNSATTPRAAAQDFALFAKDWGFSLADIRIPVHFYQGSVDRNVPAHHAELLAAATPGAILHRYPGEGHFLVVERLPEILADIAT